MLECLQKKWFLYIAGVAFFLALVRYKGFDDDAALYLLQVVDHLHPERFLNDVPFNIMPENRLTMLCSVLT